MKIVRDWLARRAQRRHDTRLLMIEKITAELREGAVSCEAVFGGPAAALFVAATARWFKDTGATNYVTADLCDFKSGERYTVTICRAGGKTPAQEIAELRRLLTHPRTP